MPKCHMQINGHAARQRNQFKVREERLYRMGCLQETKLCLRSQAKEMWNMINHDLWSAANWILSIFTLVPLLNQSANCYTFGCLRLNDKRGIIWPSSWTCVCFVPNGSLVQYVCIDVVCLCVCMCARACGCVLLYLSSHAPLCLWMCAFHTLMTTQSAHHDLACACVNAGSSVAHKEKERERKKKKNEGVLCRESVQAICGLLCFQWMSSACVNPNPYNY